MPSKLPLLFPPRAAAKRVTKEGRKRCSSDPLAMATTFRAAASKLLRERPYYPEALTDLPPLRMVLGAANPVGMTSAFRAAAMAAGEAEFPLLAPIFSQSDAHSLDLMRAARNMVSEMCCPSVSCISMKAIITEAARKLGSPSIVLPGQSHLGIPTWKISLPEDSYYIFGASAAAAGVVLLSAGEPMEHNDTSPGQTSDVMPNDASAGQTSEIIQDLKEKLSEVTERAKNLDAENKRLLEDVDKVREANNQREYEIQMETIRSRHREEIARIQAGVKRDESGRDKKGDESGRDKKGDESGRDKKGDESDKKGEKIKKDEEPLTKKLLDLLMAPSKAENLYKDITSNWAKWSSLLALVPVLFGLGKSDFRKILKGDLSALDPRVEVVESRACPCGIPWPQKCSRCGRGLPLFVGDSGLVSFPGIAVAKGETSTATAAVPRATPPQPQ